MGHARQNGTSRRVLNQDMSCGPFEFANLTAQVIIFYFKVTCDCQHLKFIFVVFEVIFVNCVHDCTAYCVNINFTALSHLSNRLKLSRRAFLKLSGLESELSSLRGFSNLLEWVGSKNSLIPLVNKRLKTEVAKHTQKLFVDHSLNKLEEFLFSLCKVLSAIMSTTFPVEDNTIRIDFVYLSNELFSDIIGEFSIESIVNLVNGICRALINEDLGAFFGLLLNAGKESVISSTFLERDDNCDCFLLVVIWLDIEPSNFLCVLVRCIRILVLTTYIFICLLLKVGFIIVIVAVICRVLRLGLLFAFGEFVAHFF